jgi:hypothetical protein
MSFNSRSHTVEDLFSGAVRLIILHLVKTMLRSRSILVSRVNADYWPQLKHWASAVQRVGSKGSKKLKKLGKASVNWGIFGV